MKKFKRDWEIQQNWQLIFPLLGLIGIIYSAFKLVTSINKMWPSILSYLTIILLSFILIRFFLFLFKKLEKKWVVNYRWEMIRIFLVFAITGSSSVIVGRPIINFMGITKENLNIVLYWTLFIIIGLIFYQILLVLFGWLFGQFKFFWEFEKKMLKRIGLGRIINE